MPEQSEVTYDQFKAEWLAEVTSGSPSTVELGNRFSRKLILQWLDYDEENDDVIFCDGAGDGGIDIALLQRGDPEEANSNDGDTWYLVQSKYGSAFTGTTTLLTEAQKIIDTLDGRRQRLSSLSEDLVERLQTFKASASTKDKIVLVFATVDPLTAQERVALDDVKAMGVNRLGALLDTDAVSVETIYLRATREQPKKYALPLTANLVASGSDLLVGSVKLTSLYQFLKDYRSETGDLDLIYEKNVRKFLGSRKKVNAGIAGTLRENPERFGLYNNGITLVVEDFQFLETDKYLLTEPYIVNGCQTTRTIWDTLYKKLESGGTGGNAELEHWKQRLQKGIVVVKVVKVGENGHELLTNTTRYTNSQNPVGLKDFIALESNFRMWSSEMAANYNVFLEVQRGGWDSHRALQKTNPNATVYRDWVNAFDILKNYGAFWLAEPGLAFGKNPPFAPGGSIFKRIVEDPSFDIKSLYAAYMLHKLSQRIGFGRNAKQQSRGQTRYLFYYVLGELLKSCMEHEGIETTSTNQADALIRIFENPESEAATHLTEAALNVIDEYLSNSSEDSIFTEPKYTGDLNTFLKGEKLGKGTEHSPKLINLIAFTKREMRRSSRGQEAPRDVICEVLR